MNTCFKCNIEHSLIYQSEFHDIYGCDKCKKQRAIQIDDCCRNPLKIVIVEQTEKTIRLLHQCVICGGIVNRHLPLSRKKYGDDIRDEMNECRFKEWNQRVHDDYLFIKEDIDKNNFEHSRRGKYMAYLNSAEWKTKRQMVLKRDSYQCQSCKQKEAVDVHHLSYDNLYNEMLEELISVCVECHNKIHDERDKKRPPSSGLAARSYFKVGLQPTYISLMKLSSKAATILGNIDGSAKLGDLRKMANQINKGK